MKRAALRFLCLLALLGLFPGLLLAREQPFPRATGWVNDLAGVLDEGDIQRIDDVCRSLEQAGYQMFVVTVDSLQGEDIQEAATRYGIEQGIGKKGEDTGLVMMLALQERKFFIATGRGTETLIPDAYAGRVYSDIIRPLLRQNRMGEALYQGALALRQRIFEQTGVAVPEGGTPVVPISPSPPVPTGGFPIGLILFAVFVVFVISMASAATSRAFRKCPRCGSTMDVRDETVRQPSRYRDGYGYHHRYCPRCHYRDRRKYTLPRQGGGGPWIIPTGGWGGGSSGGGWSGGSSGGGGGFGGGWGGDFGGGGAGGDW